MNYHFIAIGGAVMHNLALELQHNAHHITGSDDEIFEPAKSRLNNAGLLPDQAGWFPEKIHPNLDGIIVGMHAKQDNPELQRTWSWAFLPTVFLNLFTIMLNRKHDW